jgi:hypothetical protein
MEKRTYIQPETWMAVMPKYAMMGFQPSPTDGSKDPVKGMPAWRPKNPTRTPVF